MKHIIDKTCSCLHCTMLDIMFGDPTLSPWEKRFIKSVSEFGWLDNYTPKQISVIEKIFKKQKRKYTA